MDVAVAVAVAAGWWWASCRHARPATPSLIEVRAATWGEDRSARVMMVTGAELSDDSVQWQQEVAVVEGGGALKGGDAAARHGGCRRHRQGVVYTCAMFWAKGGHSREKAGNEC
jgi:hypothetical protein